MLSFLTLAGLSFLAYAQTASLAPDAAATQAPAKTAGVTRIGVVRPTLQLGQDASNMTMAEPVRNLLIQNLAGPSYEAIPLVAMLPDQALLEAKQKGCDYVVFSTLSQKLNGGRGGLLRRAMPAIAMIPVVGAAARVGMAASSAATAADVNGLVKANSEMTLSYQLMAPDVAAPVLTDAAKAKAKSAGEDLITPLAVKVDTAILAKLREKK